MSWDAKPALHSSGIWLVPNTALTALHCTSVQGDAGSPSQPKKHSEILLCGRQVWCAAQMKVPRPSPPKYYSDARLNRERYWKDKIYANPEAFNVKCIEDALNLIPYFNSHPWFLIIWLNWLPGSQCHDFFHGLMWNVWAAQHMDSAWLWRSLFRFPLYF